MGEEPSPRFFACTRTHRKEEEGRSGIMKRCNLLLAVLALGTAARADEFLGSFPSWANVQTEFGAVGDGKATELVLPAGGQARCRGLQAQFSRELPGLRKAKFPRD
jgi:hypothetical protein